MTLYPGRCSGIHQAHTAVQYGFPQIMGGSRVDHPASSADMRHDLLVPPFSACERPELAGTAVALDLCELQQLASVCVLSPIKLPAQCICQWEVWQP